MGLTATPPQQEALQPSVGERWGQHPQGDIEKDGS